ncbi:autotransporter-associated beta strand repeat-containing protein [Comamonas sp.]|uniref:autotransporter-associated beta strand repeat-containing protein n=1 Tax=Comamonas sp. TaxID=34028 RepID=UPI002586F17C|nr:autotransporter-associated beta strand repeat-containing protein [Comamonas sp.]
MNRVYRVVFNAVSGAWQAVSEIARGPGKSSRSAKRSRSSALPVMSAGALLLTLSLGGTSAYAACTPGVPTDGVTLTCAGTDQQNFASSASNLTVNVIGSAIVSSDGSGDPVLQLTGSNNIIVNSGQIYPSYSGQQSLPTTGLKVGNSSTQNITITNNPTGSISGTGANPGASIVDLKGMALDVEAGAGGKVTIVNHGTIFTNVIVGGTLEVANMPTVAVYGGAQVEMFNTNTAYGRIAFQASAEGNTFTNSGSLGGSLSMGAGGGNNRFNAITGSGVQASGVSGASSVTVASNPNLVFLAPGIVDGGAGGSNTLALQNAIGGGAGSGGSGTIFAANFLNFSNLLVQSGSWTVSGALLTGATTSTRLSGGALWVNNSGVFGTGIVNASGATLSSFATSTLILANDINLKVNALSGINGLTVSGSNNITLSGVISGDGTSPLTKTGTGVLRLDGTNTYSGGTALNAGSLVIGSSQALGTGAVNAATGTRIDSGATATLSNIINLTGTVNFGGTGNLILSGALQGNASSVLNKDGAGTLVLSNASTYGGGTTLGGGTLLVGNNASLGGGALTVSGASSLGATQSVMLNNAVALNSNLTVSGDFALRLNGNITGGAANKLIKTGSGNLTLTGTSNFQGGVELNGGTLTVATNSGALGSGAVTATGDSRLEYTAPQVSSTPIFINNGVTLDFANVVQIINMGSIGGSATSTLAKTGSGELMLFNANAFSGLLDVRQGTVTAAVANALGNNPNVLVSSGATVALTASNTINSLSGAGQVTVIAGSTFTVGAGNASSTFSGAFTGLGALTKSGTGTLTLSGISGLTGNTTVSAGRLNIGSSGSLASNLVTVANGATLGGSGTLTGGVTINSGGHLAVTSGSTLNTGTLTLSSGSNLDIWLGKPTIDTPMINVTGNVAINSSTFNFFDIGDFENGTYRLINYTGTLNYGGANPGIFPADVVLGEITLSMDNVAKTANIVINSSALRNQYWDGNTSVANGTVEGGSGVWNATNTNWTKSAGGSNDIWKGASAVFQAAAGTVVIEGSQNVSALEFKTDGYELNAGVAGALTLVNGTNGAVATTVDSNVTALIDAPIGGTGKLQKSGTGTLVLAGSNSYSGGTSLSAGTLVLRNNNALGSSALSLATGTYLRTDISDVQLSNGMVLSGVSNIQVDAGTNLTLSGTVSGTGGLVKDGSGKLTLSGTNNFSGGAEVKGGTLNFAGSGLTLSGNLNVAGSAGLGIASTAPVAVDGAVNLGDASILSINAPSSLTAESMNIGSGVGINITGINSLSQLDRVLISTTNGIHGDFGVVTIGGFSGTQDYFTHTTRKSADSKEYVASSALSWAAQNNLAHGTFTLAGATEEFDVGVALSDQAANLGWDGKSLTKSGNGTLILSGANNYTGTTTINSGTLQLGNGGASGNLGAGTVTNNGALAFNRSDTLTVANDISGAGALLQSGTGKTVLTGNNSYQGTTTINGGTLQVGNGGTSGNLGAGAVTNSGSLILNRSDALTVANDISGTGSLTHAGTGITTLAGNNSYTGGTYVQAGTLRIGRLSALVQGSLYQVNSGATLDLNGYALQTGGISGTGTVALGSQGLTVDTAASSISEFDGKMDGTGSLTKQGEGTLALNTANSFSGGINHKGGNINLGNEKGLGSGTLSMDDGTKITLTANGMTIANNLHMTGDNDPIVDTGANNATWAGAISGAGFLTKQGIGTLTMTSTGNTYTGATDVAQGTLQASAANTFSSTSAHTVAAGAVLDLAGYNQTLASLNNSGNVKLSSSSGAAPGTVLKVTGAYVGNNGHLGLSTVLGADGSATDKLLLSGASAVASGSTTVHITNAGGLGGQTTVNGIQVIGTENGASLQPGSFTLAGGHVDAGAYQYRLTQTAQGAALHSTNTTPTTPATAYRTEVPLLSALPAQLRQADMAMLGDLRKRMGDEGTQATTSSDTGASRRVWGRILRTDPKITQQGTVSPESSGHLTGFQAGLDLYADQSVKAGIYVGQLEGDMSVNGFASGEERKYVGFNNLRTRYLGVYGTWQDQSGLYADAVLQGADYRSDLRTASDNVQARTKGSGWLASLEMGKAFELISNWQVEPQAQIIYRKLSIDGTALSLATVKNQADDDWTVRLGARIKGSFATGAGVLQPYGRINVYKASNTTDIASFTAPGGTTDIKAKGGYTATEMAAGASLQINPRTSVYGELGKLWANGGDSRVKSGVQASIGVKVQW